MTSGPVLFAKEVREVLRTSRVYVIPGLFLFFGITSPLLTKLLPEIIKSLGGGIPGALILLPPPTAIDSFLQFLKNLTQVGVIAIILTMMGSVAEEKNRGTAILVLTKPVSRPAFVLAKFGAACLLVAFATALGYVAALYYTIYLFTNVPVTASLGAVVLYYVYAVFVVALTVAASAATRTQVAAAGIAIAVFVVASILPTFGGVLASHSPGALPGLAGRVLSGAMGVGETLPAMAVSLAVSAALIGLGSLIFARQEL